LSVKVIQNSIFILLLILLGCSKSEEDILLEAHKKVETVFLKEEKVLEKEHKSSFSYYIPNHLEVVDQDEYNIILEGNNNVYVIFINNFETPTSKMMFNLAKVDESLLYESLEKEGMFGYIRVRNSDEEAALYEVQIGIGGVKVTTNVNLKDIPNEAEQLMKIAKSIIEETF